MPYSAASVANAFLSLADEDGQTIDPMKIQKLCYLAHGYYLVENNNKPLLDERFEAWKFGPVLPSLYHAAKRYRNGPILRPLSDFDYSTRLFVRARPPKDPLAKEIIEYVWDEYGDMHALELSDWTHEKNGPWDQVMKSEDSFIRNLDIPNDLIAAYFTRAMYANAAQET